MPRTRKPGWRAAHGAAKQGGALTASETPPMAELPPAIPSAPARKQRGPDGKFLPSNTVGTTRRHRAAISGALAKLEAQADPSWQAAAAWGVRYARQRFEELGAAHGPLSAGVGAMITTAANTLADSRWLRARGAADNCADTIKVAAQLAAQARAAERDAWQLAALEARSRAESEGDDLAQQQRAFQKQLAERSKGGDE